MMYFIISIVFLGFGLFFVCLLFVFLFSVFKNLKYFLLQKNLVVPSDDSDNHFVKFQSFARKLSRPVPSDDPYVSTLYCNCIYYLPIVANHWRMVHSYLYVYHCHLNDWLDKMQILKIFSATKLMLSGSPGVCAERYLVTQS